MGWLVRQLLSACDRFTNSDCLAIGHLLTASEDWLQSLDAADSAIGVSFSELGPNLRA